VTGELVVDLVEAGVRREARIDLATGEATIAMPGGGAEGVPRARTPVRGKGRWRILVANVDDEVSLFVDGRPVVFDRPTAYEGPESFEPDRSPRQPGSTEPGDLSPIGIAVRGASAGIGRLRVLRDIFYVRASDIHSTMGHEADSRGYPLAAEEFFMLGDNSSASMDSRLWKRAHHVGRDLLIGKALAIFWPHGIPARWSISVPLGSSDVRLPFWPNFARMKFIR
jgi:signal peptidase I